jgi:hypothetical protein
MLACLSATFRCHVTPASCKAQKTRRPRGPKLRASSDCGLRGNGARSRFGTGVALDAFELPPRGERSRLVAACLQRAYSIVASNVPDYSVESSSKMGSGARAPGVKAGRGSVGNAWRRAT